MIVLSAVVLLLATGLAYGLAGADVAAALATGAAVEATNLQVTERVGRRLMAPAARGEGAGWFPIFYFLKYTVLIVSVSYLVVGTGLQVVPLTLGFVLALASHIALHLLRVAPPGRRPGREEPAHAA